ncbi:MAG: hypothetical protein RSB41_02180 [Bacilli bacterium]
MQSKKKHTLLKIILIFVVLIVGIVLYSRYIGVKGLEIKEYRVKRDELSNNFDGSKIIHFSDLNYKSTIYKNDVIKLVKEINLRKPDLVLFTGNFLGKDESFSKKEIEELAFELNKIETKLGIYFVKGNLDYTKESDELISKLNFKLLDNSYDLIYNESIDPIFIAGCSSSIKNKNNIESSVKYFVDNSITDSSNIFKIYLTHEGDIIPDILKSKPDISLILAGNSLNGLIDVPFYGPLFIPNGSKKYYAPYYKENNTDIYISGGLGTNIYKFRLFNKPSFNFYRLNSTDKGTNTNIQ